MHFLKGEEAWNSTVRGVLVPGLHFGTRASRAGWVAAKLKLRHISSVSWAWSAFVIYRPVVPKGGSIFSRIADHILVELVNFHWCRSLTGFRIVMRLVFKLAFNQIGNAHRHWNSTAASCSFIYTGVHTQASATHLAHGLKQLPRFCPFDCLGMFWRQGHTHLTFLCFLWGVFKPDPGSSYLPAFFCPAWSGSF
jgi:hypothetical protein